MSFFEVTVDADEDEDSVEAVRFAFDPDDDEDGGACSPEVPDFPIVGELATPCITTQHYRSHK